MEQEETAKAGVYGQSNLLVRATYSMPLYCKRLLMLGLTKITYSDNDMSDEAFTFEVTATEWRSFFGDASGTAYPQMKAAAIRLQDHPEGGIWYPVGDTMEGIRWFSLCRYNDGKGFVSMKFSHEVRPHLADLTRGGDYTKTSLAEVCTLESTYSIRLYEMCRQYRTRGVLDISVPDLRAAFKLKNKYKAFSDLRLRVIEPSVEELNKKTGMTGLKYTVKKRGATITDIRFTFKREI
jgi:plasmid replication initiation protein